MTTSPTPKIEKIDDKLFKYWREYKKEVVKENKEARRLNNIEALRTQKMNDDYRKEYEDRVKEWKDRKAEYIKKHGHSKIMPYTLVYGRPLEPISVWYMPVALEKDISLEGYIKWLDKNKAI